MGAEQKVIRRMQEDGVVTQITKILTDVEYMAFRRMTRPNVPVPNYQAKLNGLIEDVTKLVAPYTPCRSGCSACCHMAVTITQYEADRIAAAVGIPAKVLPSLMALGLDEATEAKRREEDVEKYLRVPCPFLREGSCSVYEARPIACRVYHTVYPDNSQCQLDEMREIPALNLMTLEMAHVANNMNHGVADIRAFFPNVDKGEIKHG